MDVDFEPGGRGATIFFSSDEKKEQKFPLTPDRSAGMCRKTLVAGGLSAWE